MQVELKETAYDAYMKKRKRKGHSGGAPSWRRVSKSKRATPNYAAGAVELLSTHDQRLGGPSGQSYLRDAFSRPKLAMLD